MKAEDYAAMSTDELIGVAFDLRSEGKKDQLRELTAYLWKERDCLLCLRTTHEHAYEWLEIDWGTYAWVCECGDLATDGELNKYNRLTDQAKRSRVRAQLNREETR